MPFIYDLTSNDQNQPDKGPNSISNPDGTGNAQLTALSSTPTFPSAEYQELWAIFNGHWLLDLPVNGTATNGAHGLTANETFSALSARSFGTGRGRSTGRHHTRQRFYVIPSERQDEQNTTVSYALNRQRGTYEVSLTLLPSVSGSQSNRSVILLSVTDPRTLGQDEWLERITRHLSGVDGTDESGRSVERGLRRFWRYTNSHRGD
uniref:Uncharacterized protein n=1 Tax=Kwoniella bestiolae CBS 10118 TaxID=1296100 RepID=A0A1B9GFK7_9TREE|nr:hypothetical protein I302_01343 [Kwoniella bestiolae CBS 10118]OCF29830.1 hypothetical protein I302_01343 [Kwoniella bestiolae CBS 10118]